MNNRVCLHCSRWEHLEHEVGRCEMDGGLRFQFEGVEKIQWGEHQRAFIPCAGFVACEVERVPYSECMHKIPDQVEVRPSRQARNDERRAEKAYWMIKKMENRVMKGA